MRTVRLVAPGRPLADDERADPRPAPGQIVVRVEAAGICRSDMHYRKGFPKAGPLPLTLGHEVAGRVAVVGDEVVDLGIGDRVGLHYLVTCGTCRYCSGGNEQFCATAEMLGKDRDGGYADQIVVPASNAHLVPDEVPIEHAAVMMCSTSTAYHALGKARVREGEAVAVLGVGGLGMAAVQLARILGGDPVVAVDLDPDKLETASRYGAIPVPGGEDLARRIGEAAGRPVDVVLDLVGSADLLRTGLDATAPLGRVVAVGLTDQDVAVSPYRHLIAGERAIIGCSDHLAGEIPELFALAAAGRIRFDDIVTATVPLEAEAINGVLDAMESSQAPVRTVIRP